MKMPRLKIAKLCLCIGVLLTSSVRPAEIEAGFTPLFNTANASGWVLRGDEKLAIENGIATLSGPEDRRGTAWYMKKEFGDFVLRAEFMGEKPEFRGYLRLRFADPATYSEPGVSPPNYAASGFGVVLCDPQDPWKYKTGAINEWQEPKSIPFKTEDWNEIEVSAIGQNYSVKLNGILINEFVGKKRLRGYLGLEENRRGALRFRNMCIKEILPPPLATIPSTSPQMIMTVEPQNLEDALLTYRWSWINNVPEPKKPMHRDKEVRFYKNGTALSSFHEVWNWKLTGPQSIQLVFEDGGFQRDSGISIFYSPGFTNFSYKDGRITGSRLGAVAPTTPSLVTPPSTSPQALPEVPEANPVFAPVPEAARQAIQKEAEGQTILSVERVDEDGDVLYRASIAEVLGDARDITVTSDGALVSRQVKVTQMPETLQKAVFAYASNYDAHSTVETVDQIWGDGTAGAYQVALRTSKGQTRQFMVDQEQNLLSLEVGVKGVPEAVQNALGKTGAQVETIDRILVSGDPKTYVYKVRLRYPDQRLRVGMVAEDGTVLSTQLAPEEVPTEVRQSIQANADGAEITTVDRILEDGEVTYYIGTRHPLLHYHRWLLTNKAGLLLRKQVYLTETSPLVQEAIRTNVAGGRLLWIGQVLTPGQPGLFHYEVTGWHGGHSNQVSLEPTSGKIMAESPDAGHHKMHRRVAMARHVPHYSHLHSGGGRRR